LYKWKKILFLLLIMQNRKAFLRFLVILPTLFWIVANPIVKSSFSVAAIEKSSQKDTKKSNQPVVSEQHVIQTAPTVSFDFPPNFEFKSFVEFEFHKITEPLSCVFSQVKNKIFVILFTQYISTLAP